MVAALFFYFIQFVFFTAIRVIDGLTETYSFPRRLYLISLIPVLGLFYIIACFIVYAFRKD